MNKDRNEKGQFVKNHSIHKIRSGDYSSIHHWLGYYYGRANKCEGEDCRGISTKYNWALRTGFEHKEDRTHYIMLCCSCHRRMDKINNNVKAGEVTKAKFKALRAKGWWSRKHDCCLNCGTKTIRHHSKGLCKVCYNREECK